MLSGAILVHARNYIRLLADHCKKAAGQGAGQFFATPVKDLHEHGASNETKIWRNRNITVISRSVFLLEQWMLWLVHHYIIDA